MLRSQLKIFITELGSFDKRGKRKLGEQIAESLNKSLIETRIDARLDSRN